MNSYLENLKNAQNVPSSEEKSSIQSLNLVLQHGNNILQKHKVSLGTLRSWIARARRILSRIYGKDSEILDLFPKMIDLSASETTSSTLQLKIQAISNLVDELHNAALKSFAPNVDGKVFIGHGRSPLWRELKDFLSERLNLKWDEFNREAVAGLSTFERLAQMLFESNFAFLIMTAEDEHNDSTLHARQNVIHEVGLFQGRLGPRKAIILLEEDCEEFSNIVGLSQIRFPSGHISAAFEKIRRVLERENIIKT